MNEQEYLALPVPQRKELQKQLRDQNLYLGPIDGKSGEGMRTGLKALERQKAEGEERAQQNRLREKELEIKGRETDTKAAESAAKTKDIEAETARRQRYQDQASSGLGMAAQSSANLVAPAAGTAIGMGLGRGVNWGMDKAQESRNAVLRGAAADRVSGLTTREGAREGVRLAGAMPPSNALLRTVSRMGPHIGLGALSLGKGGQVLYESDPNGEFYPRMADRAAGLGYLGVGAGLIKQGIRQAAAPGVAPDAQALAVINSNQLRRNALLDTPSRPAVTQTIDLTADEVKPALPAPQAAANTPRAGTKAALVAQARDLKIPGRAGLSKAELAEKVAETIRQQGATRAKRVTKVTGALGPALAAGIAYGATPDQAQAADGSSIGGQGEAVTNAALAGGGAYGVQRAIEALPSAASGAMRTAGSVMGPMSAGDMTDDFAGAEARNWAARNFPEVLQFGAVGEAREMATVPEPSPYRQQPMAAAESLEIPQGIPAPREDGTSPYGAPAAPQDDFESQLADLASLLQSIGSAPDPMQTAQASRAVTQMPQGFAPSNIPTNRLLAQY